MKTRNTWLGLLALAGLSSCNQETTEVKKKGMYAEDVTFMKQHIEVVELRDGNSAVAIAPAYQGRVMTSTYDSEAGPSFGWINRPVIAEGVLSGEAAKGKLQEHIHVFGGEERFWLGPEGGQPPYHPMTAPPNTSPKKQIPSSPSEHLTQKANS